VLRAVFFDFGGVILSSPFEAFNHYEAANGLPHNFIRSVNTVNHHENAWAKLERSDISPAQFDQLFAEESEALGHRIPGADILALLHGEIRPEMVRALDVIKQSGLVLACLTNNVRTEQAVATDPAERERQDEMRAVLARFVLDFDCCGALSAVSVPSPLRPTAVKASMHEGSATWLDIVSVASVAK
jgi:putative hydrolase of the HAD superfamily